MLVYVATYPRCGNSFLRNTIGANWSAEFHQQADREAMIASPALHLVKTHGRPPTSFLPGEKVVQLVRHPGAAIASQFRMKQKFGVKPRPIEDFIEGKAAGGRWDEYHSEWGKIEAPLWRWRYEDAVADPVAMIESLRQFLDLEPAPPALFTIDQANAANPDRNPGAGLDGWTQQVSPEISSRIWLEHGAEAKRHGYTPTGFLTSLEIRGTQQRPALSA